MKHLTSLLINNLDFSRKKYSVDGTIINKECAG